MLRYRRTSGNLAVVRSSASPAGGLDHLLSLANNPLAPFRDVTEVSNTHQSEGDEINADLDRRAVEQELRRYKEDGMSDAVSLVAFWEVGTLILWAARFSAHMGYITEA